MLYSWGSSAESDTHQQNKKYQKNFSTQRKLHDYKYFFVKNISNCIRPYLFEDHILHYFNASTS